MRVLRFSTRRLLLAAIVVAVGIGVGAVVYYLVPAALGPYDSGGAQQTTEATVTRKAACNAADPYDTVTFQAGGHRQQARLNGCGNGTGSQVRIVVPDNVGAETIVSLAVTEKGTLPDGYRRISVALLVLGCLGGAGYAFLLRGRATDAGGEDGGSTSDDAAEESLEAVSANA